MDAETKALVLQAQRTELTEHLIYKRLAGRIRDRHNAELLKRISESEKGHHDFLRGLSGVEVRPRRGILLLYVMIARLFGVTFGLKLMERGEGLAQVGYRRLTDVDGVEKILHEEEEHESELIDMLRDEPLDYAGSIVLGLNDALVELTGALAGLTLALAETRIVAVAGLITGVAASMSMAASEYLSSKSEAESSSSKHPLRAATYTGIAYIGAVLLLVLPYFLIANALVALACTLAIAVVIIALFNFYISVAKDLRFWPRFWEMALISLSIATISFVLGWALRAIFGIEV